MNNDDNPWQTLGSKKIYDNPWISVREDAVLNPTGGQGIYGVVSFKNLAVGIIAVDDSQYTWLVGQYRYATESYSWELPMGGSPLEDDPLTGARRELREETGLSAGHWQHLLRAHTSNSVCDEIAHVYLATDLRMGPSAPEETEQLALRHLPLQSAIDMALQGQISDCLSVAGLLRLHADILAGRIDLTNGKFQ